MRRPDHPPTAVILLETGAGAGTLSEAVRALMEARQRDGGFVEETQVLRRSEDRRNDRPLAQVLGWHERVVTDLRHAQPVIIDGIGMVPAVIIFLPDEVEPLG